MIPEFFQNAYACCELCPRRCRADRRKTAGFCREGAKVRAARAMLHPWEEPAVMTGGKPSGAVFFSGCTLHCVYCQNYQISQEGTGKELTAEELASVFLSLQEKGASNLDLVTPTHFLPGILEALELCRGKLHLPVVYNTGGYERPETVQALAEKIDFWLPDIKYFSSTLSRTYSQATDYFTTAVCAVREMISVSRRRFGEKPGEPPRVILRHMVLPGHRKDSIELLHALKGELGTEGYWISLLSQYTPFYRAADFPELNRRVTTFEYESVLEEAQKLGFDGFRQDRTSAKEEYTPSFDFDGLDV